MRDESADLVVAIAVLTRRRPNMLKDILGSLSHLEQPPKTDVIILVVENDVSNRCQAAFDDLKDALRPFRSAYVQEQEIGIPYARNRAAREAIEFGADVLMFIDDDQIAPSDWLLKMVEAYRSTNAYLIGAPLRANPGREPMTWKEALLFENVKRRYLAKERRAVRLYSSGAIDQVTIVTNNWLGDIRLFSEHNILFDETLRFTGGSDSRFCHEVRRCGLSTAWAPEAAVYETIHRSRLTLEYQYRRARDQSNTHARRKLRDETRSKLLILAPVPLRLIGVIAYALALPFTFGRTLLGLLRSLGWITGRFGAVFGRESKLYFDVTGD
jgi:succinoglycan biosynthesis protein ExoM